MQSRYFTPKEVAAHNDVHDCWVSLLGKVCNLTALLEKYLDSPLVIPLVRHAGQDISHWFDAATQDVKRHIDPVTLAETFYTPMGDFIHIPCKLEKDAIDVPWWRDSQYVIGKLSSQTRLIRIVNMLTKDDHCLEVCTEETLHQIQNRYLQMNVHATSYTWKRMGKVLDMAMTLQENGIDNEQDEFETLGIREDYYIPVIHVYFNDDLTEK